MLTVSETADGVVEPAVVVVFFVIRLAVDRDSEFSFPNIFVSAQIQAALDDRHLHLPHPHPPPQEIEIVKVCVSVSRVLCMPFFRSVLTYLSVRPSSVRSSRTRQIDIFDHMSVREGRAR